jgi:DNA-binding NarL/FixJ family response regulator
MEILVCDDHQLLSELISGVLTDRGHRVSVTNLPAEAVTVALANPIDVCVMDLGFPTPQDGATGQVAPLDAIRMISAAGARVVVLSGSGALTTQEAALEAGATRYMVKGEPISDVIRAVEHAVFEQRPHAPPGPPAFSAHFAATWTRASLAAFITPRERSVLEGLVLGESTTALARRLGVRPATARTHVQNLLGKLCVHSRLEAVALAVEYELVDLPGRAG